MDHAKFQDAILKVFIFLGWTSKVLFVVCLFALMLVLKGLALLMRGDRA